MSEPELRKGFRVQLVTARDRHTDGGERLERRASSTTFERRSFAHDGAGADLGHRLSVDLDGEDTIEEQEQLVSFGALFA